VKSTYIIKFDGAMGTYFFQKFSKIKKKEFGELGNYSSYYSLIAPELITSIHKEYVSAGSQIHRTNTFGISSMLEKNLTIKNARKIMENSLAICPEIVCYSLGTGSRVNLEYLKIQADFISQNKIPYVILESFTNYNELLKVFSFISKICSQSIIIPSMYFRYISSIEINKYISLFLSKSDILGFNCMSYSPEMLLVKKAGMNLFLGLTEFPNILPDCDYIGGCCGITPNDIRKLFQQWADALR
jgi:S-methylmethionine-dependent homocysteine/selenocysteine methylase